MKKVFTTVEEAIHTARRGKMLIIVDDPKRENEADLFIPADAATPRSVETMIRHGGGILCVAMTRERAARLELPPMVPRGENTETTGVQFTVSVNARRGVTTGVSPRDRAKTIRLLASPKTRARDLTRPGHVLGLIARDGGLLERRGHTEAAVDLARLALRAPLGVLCEVVGKGGRMARGKEIQQLARKLGIKVIALRDIAEYLSAHPLPPLPRIGVRRISEARLPTRHGVFRIIVYRALADDREHVALILGKPRDGALVRLHSQCATGDTLFSLRCDCGEQLRESMRRIGKRGTGVLLYLSQEGRGIGFAQKIKAYALQDKGMDTVEANHALGFRADARTYESAADILRDLGLSRVRLLTNNPHKLEELARFGISATRVALELPPGKFNAAYLRTKKRKLGHLLSV